jgi:hypothetical protein
MKKTITAVFLALYGAAALAQGLPVSASAVAADDVPSPSVSATATAQDVSAPYIGASVGTLNCCTVSMPVSAPQVAKEEDGSESFAMAGLGFGLFGLVGLTKFARRKKQK